MAKRRSYVFDDWSDDNPVLIGRLYASVNSNREIFAFEYDTAWIRENAKGESPGILLDPDLPLRRGRQYP